MILIQNINIIRKNGIFMKTNYGNYPEPDKETALSCLHEHRRLFVWRGNSMSKTKAA